MNNNGHLTRDFNFADLILPMLDVRYPKESEVGKVYRKVKGVLEDYAEHLGRTPNRLRILEVYNESGDIARKLDRYIDRIPRLEKQTIQRWKNYKSEIRANLRRVAINLFGLPVKNLPRKLSQSLLDLVPEGMHPVIEHLPRERAWTRAERKRGHAPVTERGLLVLSAMMNVWHRLGLSTLEELFKNTAAVRREISEIESGGPAYSAATELYPLRDKLGFEKLPPKESNCVEVKDWPQPLRQEWENFESLATKGVGANHKLKASAKRLKFSIKKLTTITIDNYKQAMGYALRAIRPAGDLSVLDLIKVYPRDGAADDDDQPAEHNPLVDIFRLSEEQKKGTVKNVGFDSGMFANFTNAVSSVAARNNYGRHIRAFRKAYVLNPDQDATDTRKVDKKSGMPIWWVDKEIERLYPEFLRIVNSGSFKSAPGRVKKARADVLFVLFFVWFSVLRYMGYRQQSVRRCIVGQNFIVRPDRSIVLHFDKTKNNKRIHMEMSESGPDSHVLLWNVLYLYYKKVYPYIVNQSGDTLGGELFVTTARKTFFRPLKDFTDFYEVFKRGRNRFLRISELKPELRYTLHPHFLRGLCADWLILVLGMSFEEAAQVLGDDPKTLERHYVDKNRVYDAGAVLREVNRRRKALLEETGASARIEGALGRIEKNYQDALAQKDDEIATLRQQHEEAMRLIGELRSSRGEPPSVV